MVLLYPIHRSNRGSFVYQAFYFSSERVFPYLEAKVPCTDSVWFALWPVLTVCLVCLVLTVFGLPCTDSVFGLPCTDSMFGLSDRSLPHCIDPDKEVTAAPAQTTAPVCPEPGTAAPLSPLDHKACECAVSCCPSPTCGGS